MYLLYHVSHSITKQAREAPSFGRGKDSKTQDREQGVGEEVDKLGKHCADEVKHVVNDSANVAVEIPP